ncbi:MAG TPA: transglycosylase domain-containing protein [Bacteroidales bacterium]|nr:transglycosylase domain-containing protein [Bacteroidales bacterium]
MKKSKGKLRNKVIKYSLILLFTFIVLTGLLLGCVYMGVFGALPNEKELTSINNEEASLVYSADNVIIGKYFAENRTNIKWDDIPKHLKNALIATEDKRFFTHKGFDVISYFRVFFKSILLRDNSGGGSTLTQQLVKNLYGRNRYGILSLPVNKMKEAIIASRLEKIYSKEELLLLYLNSVPFGEDVYGVESAARRFFSKPARKLKVEESAVLVGMLKANTYYNPVLNPNNSRERRNVVLSLMRNEKYLTKLEADSLKKLPLKIKYENANTLPAGYFVQQVKVKTQHLLDSINEAKGKDYNLEKDGLRIYTTLNMKVQEFAARAIKNHLTGMQKLLDQELENRRIKKSWLAKQKKLSDNVESDSRKRKVRVFDWNGMQTRNISKFDSLWHYYKMLHASVLVTNPKDGAVLTWVGGNNFQILPFDMVVSHRQIASAFKPILYATALEDEMEPCMYLENTKTTYEGFENWEPENYDRASTADSTVAFWYALTHSMNLPSVDLYFRVGKDKLENTCERLNFPRIHDDAPSIALGTLDLSLYEIVRAYGAFANGGIMNDLYMIRKITDAQGKVLYTAKPAGSTQVFEASTSEIMTAILQQVINQGTGAGIRSRFGIQSQLAGKTGTAQNYSDSWFIAYTPNMVIGTWVGASRPDVHFFSSRGSGISARDACCGKYFKKHRDYFRPQK